MTNEKDDQIEVEIEKVEDAAPEVEVVAAEAESTKDEVTETLDELRKRLESERAARLDAERRAQEAASIAAQARNEAEDTNLHLVTNAIGTLKQNAAILKDHYKSAMEAGDYDRVAEIQQEMANNSHKLSELERGKAAMESKPRVEVPRTPVETDPVEALASQLSPRSAQWVRSHPEYATNPVLREKMIAAHRLAVADSMAPDTDDYFDYVEGVLRIKKSEPVRNQDDDATSAAAKPVQRRSSPPAAPVSRSGTGDGSRPNVVRLTSEEREMAQMMGMTDKQYAENKLKLIQEGRLTKH